MNSTNNRAASLWLIPILGALVAFAPLSIDMYLSAFPQLARDFPGMQGVAQYSLACYLMGMAAGQIHGDMDQPSRIKELERENRELRRANEILKAASAFFGAELDRQSKT